MLLGTCGADVPGEWFSVIFRIFFAFWLLLTGCLVLCVFYEVCGSSTGRNSGHSTYFYAPDASESQLTYFLRIWRDAEGQMTLCDTNLAPRRRGGHPPWRSGHPDAFFSLCISRILRLLPLHQLKHVIPDRVL